MNTFELAKSNPSAFSALPEPYKADNCLTFWQQGDILMCAPAKGQEEALGEWQSYYDPELNAWLEYDLI